jgi:hypothetical protein
MTPSGAGETTSLVNSGRLRLPMISQLIRFKQQHCLGRVLRNELLLAQTTHVCWQLTAPSGAGEIMVTDQWAFRAATSQTQYK